VRSLITRLAKIFPQSLTSEILRIFGPELTEKFFLVFGGTTIKIPSTKEIREMQIGLAIYDTLHNAKSRAESRRLCAILGEQHDLKRKEVRKLYKYTKGMLREAKKVNEADVRVGNNQKARIKVKRKNKRRM